MDSRWMVEAMKERRERFRRECEEDGGEMHESRWFGETCVYVADGAWGKAVSRMRQRYGQADRQAGADEQESESNQETIDR